MSFFFFNDTATTEIYTLSLHDALPIYKSRDHQAPEENRHIGRAAREMDMPQHARQIPGAAQRERLPADRVNHAVVADDHRSEEHTSELQSQSNLVCRLLLEKKTNHAHPTTSTHSSLPATSCPPPMMRPPSHPSRSPPS